MWTITWKKLTLLICGFGKNFVQLVSNFCPLSNLHGRFTIDNMETNTIERYKKIKKKLKVVQVFGVFALSLFREVNDRQILPIEYWRSIVHKWYVNRIEKHLLIFLTTNVIYTQWNTDINMEGINSSFVQDCVNHCEVSQKRKIWDEVVTVLFENLSATLDVLCTQHIVLRMSYVRNENRDLLSLSLKWKQRTSS